jgi:hypothetical protein
MQSEAVTRPDLSVDMLTAVLAATCGEEPATPGEAVHLVRRHQHAFAPTLYSAWLADGRALTAGLLEELDAARQRMAFYRDVAATLFAKVPGLTSIKGLEVADLYPAGLIRVMNDLDMVALAEPDLWAAVRLLAGDGWDIDTATFSRFAGGLQVMVSMRRTPDDPYQLPYGVEVASYFALGDLGGVAPIRDLPVRWRSPAVKNLLMLINERFEQRYRARDLVDAALLAAALDDAGRRDIVAAVTRLRLAPEYAELSDLLDTVGLGTLPPIGQVRSTRLRRSARNVGFLRQPVVGTARHLQRRVVAGKAKQTDVRALAAIGKRLPTDRAIRGGMLGFGLPLDMPAPPVDRAVLRTRDGLSWVDTPVARFLLTVADEVTQADVDRLTEPGPEEAA